MPYRRLPNTDSARLKALKTAYEKGKEIPPFKLAFSQSSYQKVQSFLTGFEKAMMEYKYAYQKQIDNNKEHSNIQKKARLYLSHFIQVMNMAISRGELASNVRSFFGLDEDERKTPTLNSEHELVEWGEKIINGEQSRLARGMAPITNPTIAVVKVRYENFMDSYRFQKTLQKNQQRAQQHLSEKRAEADNIIQTVWNEVEESVKESSEDDRRKAAADYGVVYVYRKNELQKLDLPDNIKIEL
jgi:hypothetical protein